MDSLLAQIREKVPIALDSMDAKFAESFTAEKGFKFTDMTSNQAIVHIQATHPDSANIVKEACDRAKQSAVDLESQVQNALDLLVGVSTLFYFIHIHSAHHVFAGCSLCEAGSAVSYRPCPCPDRPVGCLQHREDDGTRRTVCTAI